jgi:hypothetical protein
VGRLESTSPHELYKPRRRLSSASSPHQLSSLNHTPFQETHAHSFKMVRFEPIVTLLASLPLFSYAATIPMAARGVDAAINAHLLAPRATSYWMENIAHNGSFPEAWGGASDYKVFRNVKDYGAVGDGVAVSL